MRNNKIVIAFTLSFKFNFLSIKHLHLQLTRRPRSGNRLIPLGQATAGDFETSGQQAVIFIKRTLKKGSVRHKTTAERFPIIFYRRLMCVFVMRAVCKTLRELCVSARILYGRDIKVRVSNRTPTSRDLSLKRFTSVLFTLKLNTLEKHEILFSKLSHFVTFRSVHTKKLKCARECGRFSDERG